MFCDAKNTMLILLLCPFFNAFSMNTDTLFFNNALRMATEDGASALAQKLLGDYYRDGTGVEKNPGKAFEWTLRAAIRGDVRSQYAIGEFYAQGFCVGKNPKNAFEWTLKAAQQGFVIAQRTIGDFYTKGFGVDPDLEKALEWYMKAACSDDAMSQYCLAVFYRDEIGDPWKAFSWFLKSAEHGNGIAQCEVIQCYENGIGVEKDSEKALEWSHKNGYGQHAEIDEKLFTKLDQQIQDYAVSFMAPK